jgi:hypothetical protein
LAAAARAARILSSTDALFGAGAGEPAGDGAAGCDDGEATGGPAEDGPADSVAGEAEAVAAAGPVAPRSRADVDR